MNPIGLELDFCRRRQARLRAVLEESGLACAVLRDARHVHYFTGHWTRPIWPCGLVVHRDESRPVVLTLGAQSGWPVAAEELVRCELNRGGTIVDDPAMVVWERIAEELRGGEAVGFDVPPPSGAAVACGVISILPALLRMRRNKDPDEVALLRRGAAACEAAYSRVGQMTAPGVSEMEIYAEVLAAAAKVIGEPIGEIGNDFRSGAPGGPPRNRTIEMGELMPLDLGIPVRGYTADMCRTFCVGGAPNELQRAAHARVIEAIRWTESQLRPGASCRKLHESAEKMLAGFHGLAFGHHLGHGIGLDVHEAPRLNKAWDDVLQSGDVVTVEPGLYGGELRGGIRIENDYLITGGGFTRLSDYPTDLQPQP